jgi:hypothetical protein
MNLAEVLATRISQVSAISNPNVMQSSLMAPMMGFLHHSICATGSLSSFFTSPLKTAAAAAVRFCCHQPSSGQISPLPVEVLANSSHGAILSCPVEVLANSSHGAILSALQTLVNFLFMSVITYFYCSSNLDVKSFETASDSELFIANQTNLKTNCKQGIDDKAILIARKNL